MTTTVLLGTMFTSYAQDDSLSHDKAKPFSRTQTLTAMKDFKSMYKTEPTLNTDSISVRYDQNIKKLFTLFPNKLDEGIVFHYGLETNPTRLCYLASLGKITDIESTPKAQSKISYCPFPKSTFNTSGDTYILFDATLINGYKFITDKKVFDRLKNEYLNKMKIKSSGSYINIDSKNHPLMVFHDGSGLNKFDDAYSRISATYLFLEAGAMKSANTSNIYHAPCFVFGDQKGKFPLDNQPAEHGQNEFLGKAMDVGQLCPPNCHSNPPPCPRD